MKIKVCGMNDAVFAAEAVRLGVDYLGFIFDPSSPRFVTPEKARSICSSLEQRHDSVSRCNTFTKVHHFLFLPYKKDSRSCPCSLYQ